MTKAEEVKEFIRKSDERVATWSPDRRAAFDQAVEVMQEWVMQRDLEEARKKREAWFASTRIKPESLQVRVGPTPRID